MHCGPQRSCAHPPSLVMRPCWEGFRGFHRLAWCKHQESVLHCWQGATSQPACHLCSAGLRGCRVGFALLGGSCPRTGVCSDWRAKSPTSAGCAAPCRRDVMAGAPTWRSGVHCRHHRSWTTATPKSCHRPSVAARTAPRATHCGCTPAASEAQARGGCYNSTGPKRCPHLCARRHRPASTLSAPLVSRGQWTAPQTTRVRT
mmetsp:Transcript_115620/g.373544  ORF Transcript_115620/g.373544 Transcript_115620/m.373544 type:complete len:202 (-) Transcript_115620:123-728(-)